MTLEQKNAIVQQASGLIEQLTSAMKEIGCPIVHHKISEVICECNWCKEYFGEHDKNENK